MESRALNLIGLIIIFILAGSSAPVVLALIIIFAIINLIWVIIKYVFKKLWSFILK